MKASLHPHLHDSIDFSSTLMESSMFRSTEMTTIFTDDPRLRISKAFPKLRMQILSLSRTTIESDLFLLRPGQPFTITQPQTEDDIKECLDSGHFNLHFPILFGDGVKWILRVRRDYNRPDHPICPPDHYWFGVEREATTLQAMAAAGIKTVPNAYLPIARDSITPGHDTAHFYCDFMPGEEVALPETPETGGCPIGAFPTTTGPPVFGKVGPRLGVPNELAEARLFMGSYADHQIAISTLPFEGIGQLVRAEDGEIRVGSMGQQAIQLPGPPWMIGPCEDLKVALFQYWDQQIDAARRRGQLNLRSYLSHLDKKRLLRSYGPLSQDSSTTYLKHADEAMFQYFWQKSLLSAVLDWEWAYTTIKEVAFMAPKAFWAKQGANMSEELDALTREEELLIEAYEDRQRPDLAACVRSGPKYRLIEIDHQCQFRNITAVARFRRTFGGGEKDLTFPKTMNDWQAECLEMFHDDPGLSMFPAKDRLPQPERTPPVMTPAMLAHLPATTAHCASQHP